MRVSNSSQFMVTLIGPSGDSCSSSITAAMPAAAACLLSKNHVLSPARLSKSILLSTPIADLERTCLYSIARESPPTALPTALLLNDTSGEHLVNRFAIASMTFCASSEGLTTASTLSSIFDVMLGYPKLYSLYCKIVVGYHLICKRNCLANPN